MSGLADALAGITESVIIPAIVAGSLIRPVFRLADALEERGRIHTSDQEETA